METPERCKHKLIKSQCVMCADLNHEVKDITNDLLDLPEYFLCEKNDCRLRIDVCIKRQESNKQKKPFTPKEPFPGCVNCEQGVKYWLLEHPMEDLERKPRRGNKKRNESCEHYSDCLEVAAKKDWKSFNCESCAKHIDELGQMSDNELKEENDRICEECESEFTINPNNPLCARCLGKRGGVKNKKENPEVLQEQKPVNEKPENEETRKQEYSDRAQAETPLQGNNTSLKIEFGKYAPILKEVEKLADEEVRPIDLQIIYILKQYLDTTK